MTGGGGGGFGREANKARPGKGRVAQREATKEGRSVARTIRAAQQTRSGPGGENDNNNGGMSNSDEKTDGRRQSARKAAQR